MIKSYIRSAVRMTESVEEPASKNLISSKSIDEADLDNAIRKLKNGKVTDLDKVPTTVIKNAGDLI